MYAPQKPLAPFLLLPGVLWELAVRCRNYLYDHNLLPVRRLDAPVISIGNLTLGGTGKTPLVIYVARLVLSMGRTPVLLSRGYRRRHPGSTLVLPAGARILEPAQELGDEPALIRSHVPEIWLGISSGRFRAGSEIERKLPGAVFILDDGMQHRSLARSLDLAIIDPTRPLATNRVFPRGDLREPVAALTRCQAVVINGDAEDPASADVRRAVQQTAPQAGIFHCLQQITAVVPCSGAVATGTRALPAGKAVFLVAAIGNPLRFRRDVERLGLEIKGCRFFDDHHALSVDDWSSCWLKARALGAEYILTTEKDAIKLNDEPRFPLCFGKQATRVVEEQPFRDLIRRILGSPGADGHQS